jgi:NADH-quinone oxidoreductase subunit B
MAKDGSASVIPTTLDFAVKWAQKNSLWPMPFGTSCCGIEMMSALSGTYDISRFGSEVVRFAPRQADLLLVAGTITNKMAPVIRQIYDQMLEPKWVIDEIMPVDIYVPGCPPIPEGLIYAILRLQDVVEKGAPRPRMHRLTREEAVNAMSYRKVISDQLIAGSKETREVGDPK